MAPDPADLHIPVMAERVTELLMASLDAASVAGRTPILVDGTLGMAGHAELILRRQPRTHLVGFDRDPQALGLATKRLQPYRSRIRLVHSVFDQMRPVLAGMGIGQVDALLLDLGVSSLQLDSTERGFAYARDTPLDMRMDPNSGASAADVVNGYSAKELAAVMRMFGEERFAKRIADAIVTRRQDSPITTSGQLSQIIREAIPAAARRSGGHPGKRVFQALRIEVNDELGALRRVVPAALDILSPGGRMVVLSYHSLEDRLIKREFAQRSSSPAPPDLPVIPDELLPKYRLITRGAEQAQQAEREQNPRSSSVRLRAIERTGVAA